MIREFVDLRRHEFTVVIDTSTEVATGGRLRGDRRCRRQRGRLRTAVGARCGRALDLTTPRRPAVPAGRPVRDARPADPVCSRAAAPMCCRLPACSPVASVASPCWSSPARRGRRRSSRTVTRSASPGSVSVPRPPVCRARPSPPTTRRSSPNGGHSGTSTAFPASPTVVASSVPWRCWSSRAVSSLSAARVVGTRFEPILFVPAGLGGARRMADVAPARRPPGRRSVGGLRRLGSARGVSRPMARLATFARGLLDGPRQVITTAWPSPRFPTIFVALAALIYLATAISIDLAMRTRWRALAIVPMVVAMVATDRRRCHPTARNGRRCCSRQRHRSCCCGSVSTIESPVCVPACWSRCPPVLRALITTVGVSVCRGRPGQSAPWRSRQQPAGAARSARRCLRAAQCQFARRSLRCPRRPHSLSCTRGARLLSMCTTANPGRPAGRLLPVGNRLAPATGAEQVDRRR